MFNEFKKSKSLERIIEEEVFKTLKKEEKRNKDISISSKLKDIKNLSPEQLANFSK